MNYEKYLCKSKLNPPFVFNIAKEMSLVAIGHVVNGYIFCIIIIAKLVIRTEF